MAHTRLTYPPIHSPINAFILSDTVEEGEFVAPRTTAVSIANLEKVWLRAYLDERDLGKINLGQAVDVFVDSYPDKIYPGKVSFISSEAEFTPKNVQTAKERVTLVYRIKVDVPNIGFELKPGMPADGLIPLNELAGA